MILAQQVHASPPGRNGRRAAPWAGRCLRRDRADLMIRLAEADACPPEPEPWRHPGQYITARNDAGRRMVEALQQGRVLGCSTGTAWRRDHPRQELGGSKVAWGTDDVQLREISLCVNRPPRFTGT